MQVSNVQISISIRSEIRNAPPERVPRNVDARVFSHTASRPPGGGRLIFWLRWAILMDQSGEFN